MRITQPLPTPTADRETGVPLVIHTIGHSTHTAQGFHALLEAHGIRQLADVRAFPGSRRHPHFGQAPLAAFLTAAGIRYRHFPGLGGHRKPHPDSINTGLRHPGFRGYADHMQMDAFRSSLDELLAFAAGGPTTVMCAEAVWWRCHRRLLADALFVRNVIVRHILSPRDAKAHELSEFAREQGGWLTYPGLL
ncbi:MAG: DUF488 domain-containing protein [Acidobacteriota bacterium]